MDCIYAHHIVDMTRRGAMETRLPLPSVPVRLASAFIVIAVFFGGGGSPAPLAELVVQLSAICMVLAAIWASRSRLRLADIDWPILILSFLFIMLLVAQLIPLPAALWQSLPGRESLVAALATVDRTDNAWPISIDPWSTRASLVSLIAPLTLLGLVASLDVRGRTNVVLMLLAMTVISAILGMLQVISPQMPRFYAVTHQGFATGFFANRNATADFFTVGLVACLTVLPSRLERMPYVPALAIQAALIVLLGFGVLLTGSRTGIAIAAIVTLAGLAVQGMSTVRLSFVRGMLACVAVVVSAAALFFALAANPVLERSFNRYASFSDARPALWEDTRFAIAQSWPVGTGVGTFKPVLTAIERLEVVDLGAPNRAHNDFLEFTLEAGVPGLLLLAIGLAVVMWRATPLMNRDIGPEHRRQLLFAVATLTVFGLHSIVDYPMRTVTLGCVAAMSLGLLSRLHISGEAGCRKSTTT